MQMTTDIDNGVTLSLMTDESDERITITLRDTDQGVEQRVTTRNSAGAERTVIDKLDRATPPLDMMIASLASLYRPFLTSAQSTFNKVRLERLKREGRPITMRSMCMCGEHTGEEYEGQEFTGGIVGVPTHAPEPDEDEVDTEFLNSLWGDE
jgi:hypothetical protein